MEPRLTADINDSNDSRFPVEIWDDIFHRLPQADVLSISQVNRTFYAISIPILYHTIRPKTAVDYACFEYLGKNSLLASSVRSVEIVWEASGCKPTNLFFDLVNRTLRQLHGLEVLALKFPYHPYMQTSLSNIFEGCSFRLTSLSVSFYYDASFTEFLASQSSIVNLSISGYHLTPGFNLALPPSSLPHLTRLTAPMLPASALTNLIRGAPVHRVALDYSTKSGELAAFKALSLSSVPITHLSIRLWERRLVWLKGVVEFAGQIRRLTIHVQVVPELDNAHKYLSKLPALKTIEIYGDLKLSFVKGAHRQLALSWFQHCPRLEAVQFSRSAWRRRKNRDVTTIEPSKKDVVQPWRWSETWR